MALLCSLTGIRKANELSRKKNEIRQSIELFEELGRQIKYTENTLKSILGDYCSGANTLFSKKFEMYIKENDFPLAWKKAFSQSKSALGENEKRIFLTLADKLGTTDSTSQENIIEYAVECFQKELQKAEKDENEKKRLYIITGIAGGIAAAIMMI